MNALAPAETADATGAADAAEAQAAESPLEGFRIGVTSHRRSQDLIEALERRGAEVMHAPALKIAPVQEDMRLIEDTRTIIAAKPDLCIATTAYGMRRWCEAADSFGIGDATAGNPGRLPDVRPRPQGPRRRPRGRSCRRRNQQRRNHRNAGGHAAGRRRARQDRGRAAARLHGRPPAGTAAHVRRHGPDRHPVPLGQARRRRPAAAPHRGRLQREPRCPDLHQRTRRGRHVEHRPRNGRLQAAHREPEDHRDHRRGGPVTAQPLLDAGRDAADPGPFPDGRADPAGRASTWP